MTKIGLLSDTHGHFDDRIAHFFANCDEIWHAGDIGTIDVIRKLSKIAPVRAVYGNIDGQDLRIEFPLHNKFKCEEVKVWITHIGGYPGRYDKKIIPQIYRNPPQIFISGHSHILKVVYDKKLSCLHINPGAYGKSGFHKVRTAVRFEILGRDIKNLEVLEIERESKIIPTKNI